jgi:CubicO group peptidase (beta-lactamase class C family)
MLRHLKEETVRQMTANQIGDLTVGPPSPTDGFGLGFGVLTERNKGKTPMSVGSYSWGGAFYTYFWVDPQNELVGVMMTQIALPWGDLKLIKEFTKRTYEALTD